RTVDDGRWTIAISMALIADSYRPARRQAVKTIGVLGGMGPQATMDFEARLHAVAQHLIPQRANNGYPPMVVYYHRSAPVIADAAGHPIPPLRPDPRFLT